MATRTETPDEARVRTLMVTMPATAGIRLPAFGGKEMSLAEIADYLEDLHGIVTRAFERLNKVEDENRTYRNTFRGLHEFMSLVKAGGIQ